MAKVQKPIEWPARPIMKLLVRFNQASWKKKVIIIVAVLILTFFLRGQMEKGRSKISYQTESVKTDTIVHIVSETGEIMTTGKTDVASTIKGIVDEVYVKNGDEVKRGQDLFKVTSTATEQERAKARADYLKAKADLETAKSNQYAYQADMFGKWDEFKELAESDEYDEDHLENRNLSEYHIPEKEWLAAESKYINQERIVAQAQADLNEMWLAYQATIDGVVKSPASGTIANLSIVSGQHVDINSTALVVKSIDEIWVIVAVNENDIATVTNGQQASVSVDALNSKKFIGTVKRVDEIGTVESGIVTYNVYIALSDADNAVKPGMTVQVNIETEKKDNVLVVPNNAIKPYQGGKAIQIIDNKTGQLLYLPVEVGIRGPIKSEIVNGLKEGQEVVIGQAKTTQKTKGSNGGIFPVPKRK